DTARSGRALAIIRVCLAPLRPARSGAASPARFFRPILERGDGGQAFAFEELEEGAAAGRDIGDIVGDAELLDGGERIAAARDRERAARGHRLRDPARAGGERG